MSQLRINDITAASSNSRECPFCSSVFARVDGARRHAKSCSKRGHRRLPAGKRGRKTKACHQCARVKVYCNGRDQTPCERCVSRELHCSFSRSLADATHQQSTTIQEQDQSHSENLVHGGRVPLSFLLNVTDAKQDFITEKAVGEEPDAALLGPTCVTPPQSRALGDAGLHYIEPTLLFLGGLYNTEVEDQNLLGAFLSPSSQEDRLSERLDLLELHVAAHASSGDRYRGSFDSASFRNFFSVSNVNTFAMIFCRKRHYQFPVIHWPTFALEEASPPLLMVVALTGATYSYRPGHPPEHITGARKLYHLADSYVFHQLVECLDHIPSDIDLVEAIQLCQAALLMYALDTLSATDSAMQHMAMTQRLPALISTMRRLGFIGLRHQPSEDWQLFLQREHIIRLVSWTFCADCIATMSCNNLPILSTMEMSGDLPCDPGLWEIDSSSDFEILKSSHQGTSHCLKDLMPKFLHENGEGDIDWESLPLFHLHIMLCALQQIIFNLHVAMFLTQQSEKLLHALGTWRNLWGRALEKVPDDRRKWLGVAKNLPDIEHLSRRIIEVAISSKASFSPYLQRIPSYSAREIHEFIRDFVSKT